MSCLASRGLVALYTDFGLDLWLRIAAYFITGFAEMEESWALGFFNRG